MDSLMVIDTPNSVYLTKVNFTNGCSDDGGGAIRIDQGAVYAMKCSFQGGSAPRGGAIYAGEGTTLGLSECVFTANVATFDGGGVYCPGEATMWNCSFTGNSANNGNGGAIYAGDGAFIDDCIIQRNSALYGGGVYLSATGRVKDSKIYMNTAAMGADDLTSPGSVSIEAESYSSLFEEEMASGGYNAYGWFLDSEGNRFAGTNQAEPIDIVDTLSAPSLKFVLFKETVIPEPEPEPEPELKPEPKPEPEKVIIIERVIEKEVEKEPSKNSSIKNIKQGAVELEGKAAVELTSVIKRFMPTKEPITRGTTASFIYGLMTEDSKAYYIKRIGSPYSDMDNSPYKTAASVLTAAGILNGQSENTFAPGDILTYGQLLSIMTRFAEPPKTFVPFITEHSHWAEAALQTAVAVGWFPDLPVNLDAPATYGSFVDLLSRVFEI